MNPPAGLSRDMPFRSDSLADTLLVRFLLAEMAVAKRERTIIRRRRMAFKYGFGRCAYCGTRLCLKKPVREGFEYMTLDHVVPRSRLREQPHNFDHNTLPACRRCNVAKQSKPVVVFLRQLHG